MCAFVCRPLRVRNVGSVFLNIKQVAGSCQLIPTLSKEIKAMNLRIHSCWRKDEYSGQWHLFSSGWCSSWLQGEIHPAWGIHTGSVFSHPVLKFSKRKAILLLRNFWACFSSPCIPTVPLSILDEGQGNLELRAGGCVVVISFLCFMGTWMKVLY